MQMIRSVIKDIQAYQVADASGLIKLDAMENPYVWPAALRDAWVDMLRGTHVNRYPDPTARALSERLREAMAVPPGMRVLLGNGSDELIQMIAMSLSGASACVLSVEPTFVMYRLIAIFCGMRYVGVPLQADDFRLDLPAVRQAMEEVYPLEVPLVVDQKTGGNWKEVA